MIVKVKTLEGWYVETDICNVVYEDARAYYCKAGDIAQLDLLDPEQKLMLHSSKLYPKSYNRIRYEDSKGRGRQIYFDDIAYLCNDNGKTLEVLHTCTKPGQMDNFKESKILASNTSLKNLCEPGTGRTAEIFRQALKLSELKVSEVLIMCKHFSKTDAFYEVAKQLGYDPERLSPSTVRVRSTQYRLLETSNSDFLSDPKDTIVFYDHSVYEK